MEALSRALDKIFKPKPIVPEQKDSISPAGVKRVKEKPLPYSYRHRGQWFRPEYDFTEIQIAQKTDSYMFRAVKKKVDRFLLSGMDFVGENDESLSYIKTRIREIEIATNRPFQFLLVDTVYDLIRYSNCMWVKTRDINNSSGNMRVSSSGKEIQPVCGYHILPFETLHFKSNKNGEIIRVLQRLPDGFEKEFPVEDCIHFYANKDAGFSVGTPELFPALDDIALLRGIEENVTELIETNLFPVYHYQVGTETHPARTDPEGRREIDVIKQNVEYMPAGAVYVSDWRHKITAIGSEGKALALDFYLNYFKARVFAAIGTSSVDMGEGDTSNRSTASTLSKATMLDVEAVQMIVKLFIDFYVISELMLEGGYDLFDDSEKVEIRFGVVDREERNAFENQVLQKFAQNAITHPEMRKALGERPFIDEDFDGTNYKLFSEPATLAGNLGYTTEKVLSDIPSSNITQSNIKQGLRQVHPPAPKAPAKNKSLSNKTKPSNQHGTRKAPKTNRDVRVEYDKDLFCLISCDVTDNNLLSSWNKKVNERYRSLADSGISYETVVENMLFLLENK